MSAIDEKYSQLGGPNSFLGQPKDEGGGSEEMSLPDGRGRSRDYHGGSIFWTQETGAHELHGDIRVKWAMLGGTRSFLGYPLTDESPTPDGRGRFNHFQGGSIYWTPQTHAHEVHGAIRDHWASLGWERSRFGYPTSDEKDSKDGGRYSEFEGGAIFWHPQRGINVRVRID